MPNPEIEEFAKLLIEHMRDAAIESGDLTLRAKAVGPVATRWREVTRGGDLTSVVRAVIPDIVDKTIAGLLRAIDDGNLKLTFTASNGKTSDLTKDGRSELCGWFMGSGGWRAMYSKQRFVDDFADLM